MPYSEGLLEEEVERKKDCLEAEEVILYLQHHIQCNKGREFKGQGEQLLLVMELPLGSLQSMCISLTS